MKSIPFGIGCLLAVLVVGVFSADNNFIDAPKTTRNIPYNFSYYKLVQSLLMEIKLKNIPPSVTAVTVAQFSYDGSYGTPQAETFVVNVDKKTREGKFMIQSSLTSHQVWVVVKLLNVGGELCNETKVIEGRVFYIAYYWNTTNSKREYYKNSDWKYDVYQTCLAPKACEMVLDFKDACKEQLKSTYGENVECYIKESQYNCTFVRAANYYHHFQLSQNYEDDSVIGPIFKVRDKTTKFMLELELFDNNTLVKVAPKWPTTIATTLRSDTLRISAQDISNPSSVTILKYTNTTDVWFSCEQYEQRFRKYVGFINTTDNKITTHHTTIMKNKITMEDNGTILCCVVYEYSYNGQGTTITRFVKNKTLLIYQTQESTSTNLTESPVQNNTSNDKSPAPSNKTQDESSVTAGLLIGLGVVMGVAATVGCIVILHRKKATFLRCVKSNSEEPPQTYIPHNPFYVNLLFREQCQAEILAAEHIYEEIK